MKLSSKVVIQIVCALRKDMAPVGMAKTEREKKKGTIIDLSDQS